MKKTIFFLGFITLFFMVSSCETNSSIEDLIEDTDPEGNGTAGILSAKIDGVTFTSQSDKVESKRIERTDGSKTFSVTAKNEKFDKFTLIVSFYEGVGTYDAVLNSLSYHVNGDDRPHTAIKEQSAGSIVIISDDGTTIKGTFSFTGTHQTTNAEKIITDGTFTVNPTLVN
ncbi:DUF6252 family protein [Polaribacter sp. MSW13]|uniref:DUF6252 family protein n=1 Tax=Polaribacter marinus TaxID=2916838 RepID=A0A9X1VLX5_9FLAO|nr:DUF6252 family protein [Polaribacter marinus]MCI2227978.1 DUF6252 family protein [Polaribacter marinus]